MNMMEAFLDGVSLVTIAKTVFAFAPLILPAAAGGPTDYRIARSLRFRSGNSAYLSRTFGTPTAQNTWTLSWWQKLSGVGTRMPIFNGNGSNANRWEVQFNATTANIALADASTVFASTNSVFRDPSAWEHMVLRCNGSGTSPDFYRNGILQTKATANNFTTCYWNVAGQTNYIGTLFGSGIFYNGYLAEIIFVDGQALTPSSFGADDAVTGVWNPKAYAGTYGANGFKLDFSDNSAATAGAIGADRSGNGNNWTPTNISVTAGVTNDSFVDTPTNYGTDTGVGGEVRGNYCVLNSLTPAVVELSNGNLRCVSTATRWWYGTFGITSGKWYWETTITAAGGSNALVGISTSQAQADAGRTAWYGSDGNIYTTVSLGSNGSTFTTGDVIGVAFDADAGKLWFSKNGTFTGSPTAGTGNIPSGLTSGPYFPFVEAAATGTTLDVNFGQRPFAYTAPSGYKALCTQNLPDPAIKKPSQYMDVNLRTGTGATGSVTGKGFQPDLLWTKGRSSAVDSAVNDSGRGVGAVLRTNTTGAETTGSPSNDGITSFNSDGFSFGANANSGTGNVNVNAVTYVDWMWKEGATPGFDIVTYTGNGALSTISHSLGVAPSLMIIKRRSAVEDWCVYHSAVGAGSCLFLDLANAPSTSASLFNNTAPTSSVFTVNTNTINNGNATTYVAYLFANVPGFSKFGSYVGNGNVDGPFVNCGFRPRWILAKDAISPGQNWFVFDTARSNANLLIEYLRANSNGAEATFGGIDVLSNGFKIRTTSTSINTSGNTVIYAAFAENPFKYSRAR